jgi:hypothetical protein
VIQTITNTDRGAKIRIAAGFNMSAYTDLILTFDGPSGASVEKSFLNGFQVLLGGVDVFDTNLREDLLANTYVEYIIEATFPFPVDGPWRPTITYVNTNTTPNQSYSGKTNPVFEVCEGG